MAVSNSHKQYTIGIPFLHFIHVDVNADISPLSDVWLAGCAADDTTAEFLVQFAYLLSRSEPFKVHASYGLSVFCGIHVVTCWTSASLRVLGVAKDTDDAHVVASAVKHQLQMWRILSDVAVRASNWDMLGSVLIVFV